MAKKMVLSDSNPSRNGVNLRYYPGKSLILSPGREKDVIKKSRIEGFLNIFDEDFFSAWVKSGFPRCGVTKQN
jgi:hypothetical protein